MSSHKARSRRFGSLALTLSVLFFTLTSLEARAQYVPDDEPIDLLTNPRPFVGLRYSSFRASNGDGVRSLTFRLDKPLAADQDLRVDLPLVSRRFEAAETITGLTGTTISYFKFFNHGQRFRLLAAVPFGPAQLSSNELILSPSYSISSSRGPFTFTTGFDYSLGLFKSGAAPATNLLSVSPSLSYRYKRIAFDVDYFLNFDFANGGTVSTSASLGPDLSYTFDSGLRVATGYAFPLSAIRDPRLFQRTFYLNVGIQK